jgi:hypothetical protein
MEGASRAGADAVLSRLASVHSEGEIMKTLKLSAAVGAALVALAAASTLAVALPKVPAHHGESAVSEVTLKREAHAKKHEAKAEHKKKVKKAKKAKKAKAKKVKKAEKKK